jgi:L-aminopeptidase/D-esterase-like protein
MGWRFSIFLFLLGSVAQATCFHTVAITPPADEVTPLNFNLPGLQIASLVDPTRSTGATLFYFPNGAYVNFDARGGSVASVETTLLEEGGYSNQVDGIIFAGGSTMGLEASGGVRRAIFNARADGTIFDAIPSVPGAVVFDFGGRILPTNDLRTYPDHAFGMELMNHLSGNTFSMGRTGAGATTTVNKMGHRLWGGQGAAFRSYRWGRLFAAVVPNAMGDILKSGQSLSNSYVTLPDPPAPTTVHPRENTTLSFLLTDVKLDRNQLKQLSKGVHAGMAQMIDPFHTAFDGDINFAASLGTGRAVTDAEVLLQIQIAATGLMREAIENSIRASNRPR